MTIGKILLVENDAETRDSWATDANFGVRNCLELRDCPSDAKEVLP